jgi:putative sterol carrier protein
VLEIDGRRARARTGHAPEPALKLSMPIADFLRIVGGSQPPGEALLLGRIRAEGDFSVLARLGEMFGRSSGY